MSGSYTPRTRLGPRLMTRFKVAWGGEGGYESQDKKNSVVTSEFTPPAVTGKQQIEVKLIILKCIATVMYMVI